MPSGAYVPAAISGSVDGKVPVYNPDGRFDTYHDTQVFWGTHGEGRYVPNVKDLIFYDDGTIMQVVRIDPTTLVPELKPWGAKVNTGGVSTEDLLVGVGPGGVSETYRVYVDKSVIPYTVAVDARCYLYGKDVKYIQLVKGSVLDGSARVISGLYDQSGNYLGENVPLELAAMRDHSNSAVWAIPTFTTNAELVDNDVVYLHAFSDTGALKSKFPLLVENSQFIRLTDSAYKYVTHISLDTPFLSTANPHLIEYPLNVAFNGMNMFGVVHYNDGSTARMPVDGTKFQMFGFERFVATTVGERTPLLLQYNLSDDEIHYGNSKGIKHAIQQAYTAVSVKEEGSYTVKLYCVPVWINEVVGYRLEYYMYWLDRKLWMNVTPYVKVNANLNGFNPTLFGVNQQISVSINLRDVNGSFKNWVHVQVIDVLLKENPAVGTDPALTSVPLAPNSTTLQRKCWSVGYERAQSDLAIGYIAKLLFVDANRKSLNIAAGFTKYADWLAATYTAGRPLYSSTNESGPVKPDYIAIDIGHDTYEFPIEQWDTELPITGLVPNNATIVIRFIKRNGVTDLQLGMCAMVVKHLNVL